MHFFYLLYTEVKTSFSFVGANEQHSLKAVSRYLENKVVPFQTCESTREKNALAGYIRQIFSIVVVVVHHATIATSGHGPIVIGYVLRTEGVSFI